MILNLLLILSSIIYPCKKEFIVSGHIFISHQYCGGADPGENMIREIEKPQAKPGFKLYLKEGSTNNSNRKILRTIVCDSTGAFEVKLPRGKYCIIDEQRINPVVKHNSDKNYDYDEDCFKNYYSRCLTTIEIGNKNIKQFEIIYTISCSWNKPCSNFKGNLPPMMENPH